MKNITIDFTPKEISVILDNIIDSIRIHESVIYCIKTGKDPKSGDWEYPYYDEDSVIYLFKCDYSLDHLISVKNTLENVKNTLENVKTKMVLKSN